MSRSALPSITLALALATPALARCVPCGHRNSEAKREFKIMTGHPHGWPGHEVDHVVPLA
jgi:hypothetical protein